MITSGEYGGNGGWEDFFDIPVGEFIKQVIVYSGSMVDSLQFVTDKGTTSQKFGGNGGNKHVFTVPEGAKLVGLYGRTASYMNSLGFYYGKM